MPEVPARRRTRLVAAGLVVVLVGGGAGAFAWSSRGLPDDAAFAVGDRVVTEADLRAQAGTLRALYGVEVPSDDAGRDGFWRDVAKSTAVGLVLADAAEERGVDVDEREAEDALAGYVAQLFGEGDEGRAAFLEALGDAGASRDQVVDEIRRQLVVADLFEDVTAGVEPPTAEQVAEAYAARSCVLGQPERRRIQNIVVLTEGEAQAVVRRLRGGEPWAEVAAATSADESTREDAGDLGLLAAEQLEPAFAEVAFAAGRGELLGPVQGSQGWNVARVVEVVPPSTPTLEEASAALTQALLEEERSQVWAGWLEDALRAAEVEYAASYRPEDPFSPPPGTDFSSDVPDCEAPE